MSSSLATANGIEIAYETFGDPADPPIVLVMGLSTQMIAWPEDFCRDLAGRGHFIVRFDNRDVGLSTHLRWLPAPEAVDVLLRRRPPAYRIEDMAADVAGLLETLNLPSVHLVGASMGGFIAQTLALRRPELVRSLTLMMSSTGSRRVGRPSLAVLRTVLRRRVVADNRDAAVAASMATYQMIGSPGYPLDVPYMKAAAGLSYDRGYDVDGQRRQFAAVATQSDRTDQLRGLRIPTLVMHGLHDPLVSFTGGLALARTIPGARLIGFSGMGHDLPRPLWSTFATEIDTHIKRSGT